MPIPLQVWTAIRETEFLQQGQENFQNKYNNTDKVYQSGFPWCIMSLSYGSPFLCNGCRKLITQQKAPYDFLF